MADDLFHIKQMDLKLKTRLHNSTIIVSFPKEWCDMVGITGAKDEYIQLVAYMIIRAKSIKPLCTIYSKDI